jgi:hypothetical protein
MFGPPTRKRARILTLSKRFGSSFSYGKADRFSDDATRFRLFFN